MVFDIIYMVRKICRIHFCSMIFEFSVIPFESALYVIDIFFYDGIKVLFQLALTILSENEESLSKCHDDGDAIMILTSYLDSLTDENVSENENEKKIIRLIKLSYMNYNNITEEEINRLRLKHRLKVVQTMAESILQSAAKNTLRYTLFSEYEIKDLFYVFKVIRKKNHFEIRFLLFDFRMLHVYH